MTSQFLIPVTTRGYWQFKSGTLAELKGASELPADVDWFYAWDRGLGAYVCYEAR